MEAFAQPRESRPSWRISPPGDIHTFRFSRKVVCSYMGLVVWCCFAWLCYDALLIDLLLINERYLTNHVGWLGQFVYWRIHIICLISLYMNLPVHLLVVRFVRRGLVALPVQRALRSDTSNVIRTIIGFDCSGAFTFYHPHHEHVFTTMLHHVLARGCKRVRPTTGTIIGCLQKYVSQFLLAFS